MTGRESPSCRRTGGHKGLGATRGLQSVSHAGLTPERTALRGNLSGCTIGTTNLGGKTKFRQRPQNMFDVRSLEESDAVASSPRHRHGAEQEVLLTTNYELVSVCM